MRFTREIAAIGLCCVLMSGCASSGAYQIETYVVRPQDTLYSIAWRHNVDYRELAKWNNIGASYRLTVGQILVLRPSGAPPPGASRAPSGSPSVGKPRALADVPASQNAPSSSGPTGGATGPAGAGAAVGATVGANTRWVWPTDREAAPRPVPGGGILLFGQLGQDVRSAAVGRVVYTGNGIRGYGNLIIIKHADSMLSSYAHNREILVHEGQDVLAGQVVAHMGTGPHQVAALYFEIRVNGKPVDPMRYLQ